MYNLAANKESYLVRTLSFIRLFSFLLIGLVLTPSICFGDGDNKQSSDRSSGNFGKTEHFLPGEEVVTPTGKTMKVWSTKGPVAVSDAPEPFHNEGNLDLENVPVVIDAEIDGKRGETVRDHRDRFDLRERDKVNP